MVRRQKRMRIARTLGGGIRPPRSVLTILGGGGLYFHAPPSERCADELDIQAVSRRNGLAAEISGTGKEKNSTLNCRRTLQAARRSLNLYPRPRVRLRDESLLFQKRAE